MFNIGDNSRIGDCIRMNLCEWSIMSSKIERAKQKSNMPRTRLGLQHTENCTVLPNRGELLFRLRNGGVAAEVGVAFGEFTSEILLKNRPKKLHLIDLWEGDRYGAGLEQIERQHAKDIEKDVISIHRGHSVPKLEEFDEDYFDWVYIDTNHTFNTTMTELRVCDRKVKRNGRIAGHDFCTGNVIDPVPYGVIEACSKFCQDYGWQFEYLTIESHGHFSFCLMRL